MILNSSLTLLCIGDFGLVCNRLPSLYVCGSEPWISMLMCSARCSRSARSMNFVVLSSFDSTFILLVVVYSCWNMSASNIAHLHPVCIWVLYKWRCYCCSSCCCRCHCHCHRYLHFDVPSLIYIIYKCYMKIYVDWLIHSFISFIHSFV